MNEPDAFDAEELRLLHEAYEREVAARELAEHELFLYKHDRGSTDDLAHALRELLDATA